MMNNANTPVARVMLVDTAGHAYIASGASTDSGDIQTANLATYARQDEQTASLAAIRAALPEDPATGTNQDAANYALSEMASKQPDLVGGRVPVEVPTPLEVFGSIDVDGVATSAAQTQAITALQAIRTTIDDGVAVSVTSVPDSSVTVKNASIPVTDNGGSLTVDGTVAATQQGTWTVTTTPSAPNPTGNSINAFRNPALTGTAAVKASAGRIQIYHIYNPNPTVAFLHLYDATVSTGTPLTTLSVPPGEALDGYWGTSYGFNTAITAAASTSGTSVVAPATGLLVNFGYI